MGLFSSSTVITVSSTAYNLAGPQDKRPNYLKTAVASGILTPERSIADTITNAYLTGPGINFRNFGHWSQNNGYGDLLGIGETGRLAFVGDINPTVLATLIPHPVGKEVVVQTTKIGPADYSYWVDRYMIANHVSLLNTAYTTDFDGTTITITFADTTVETFVPPDFNQVRDYLYVSYLLRDSSGDGSVVTGTTNVITMATPFPSTSGWTVDDITSTPSTMSLAARVQTHSTFSDARTPVDTDTTTTTTGSWTEIDNQYERTTYLGLVVDPILNTSSVSSQLELMYQNQVGTKHTTVTSSTATTTITGGVIKTTVTTNTTDTLVVIKSYRTDTQLVGLSSWSNFEMFIYGQGTGNPSLDAFFAPSTGGGTYLPYIPIRINNVFVSPSTAPDIYPLAKKALKKAIKANFDDLVTKIADNAQIGDIDYAYVVFGTSLNTQENAARRYIYSYFKQVMEGQALDGAGVLAWQAAVVDISTRRSVYVTWLNAQSDPTNPLYGTTQPFDIADITYPPPPNYGVRIASTNRTIMAFDMQLTWSGMIETVHAGVGRAGAKAGDLWFEMAGPDTVLDDRSIITGDGVVIAAAGENQDKFVMHWQTDADTYNTLTLYGLVHANFIYQGRAVYITAAQALADADESGFLIPMNTEVFHSMPLTAATQMSTACAYLVINTYQSKKVPWYTSGFFKIFIVIIVIIIAVVVTIFTGGAGTPGVLGTAGAVGSALGAAGTAAVIIGAALNAIAAMIVVQIISTVSTSLFGAKVGAIIGTIASIIAVSAATSAMSGMSSISVLDQLGSAQNLMKLTSSILDGAAQFMNASTQDSLKQSQDQLTAINSESKDIQTKYEDLTGPSMVIDPMALIGNPILVESPTDFFNRTLMTGSDIAGLSLDMISNFANINLSTKLPG